MNLKNGSKIMYELTTENLLFIFQVISLYIIASHMEIQKRSKKIIIYFNKTPLLNLGVGMAVAIIIFQLVRTFI